jgi:hypothetical protein
MGRKVVHVFQLPGILYRFIALRRIDLFGEMVSVPSLFRRVGCAYIIREVHDILPH